MLAFLFAAVFAAVPALAFQRPRPPAPAPAPAPPAPAATGPAQERGRAVDDKGPRTLGFDEVEQAEGRPGDLPPLVLRMDFSVANVDQDAEGRSRTDLAGLVGLAGADGGFALLYSDERDGARGFLVQRFDAEFRPLAAPGPTGPAGPTGATGIAEPVEEEPSGKGQGDACLAVAPDGRLAAVWFDADDRQTALRGRFFAGGADAPSTAWRAGLPAELAGESAPPPPPQVGGPGVSGEGGPGERTRAGPVSPAPALLWSPAVCALAWNHHGRVVLRELDPRTAEARVDYVLGRRSQAATSAPRLAAHPGGELGVAFESGGGIVLHFSFGPAERAYVDGGTGRLYGFAADPAGVDSGWWILVRRQGRLALCHLGRGGAPDRPELELPVEPWRTADLAVGSAGACVLVQYAEGGLEALWVDAAGAVARTEIAPQTTTITAARVAFARDRAAFAWTERAEGVIDLVARTSAFGGEDLGPARPVEGCRGCATQHQAAVACAGDLGLVAWSDQRFEVPVIGVRGFTAQRAFGPSEAFLPAQEDGGRAAAKRPAVALQPSGRALVAWIGAGAGGPTVLAQALSVDASAAIVPAGPPFEVELEPVDLAATFPPVVIALREERGFALAWVRASPGTRELPRSGPDDGRSEVRVVRVGNSGRIDGAARTVGQGSRLAHPALAQLDDGRVAVAWDAQPRQQQRRLAARVLSERLDASGRELSFETMWRDSDHTPALAPAAGGFALAWESGEDADADVFARVYDFGGRPLSRPLALSPRAGGQGGATLARASDGSHVAVWQDDLSGSPCLVGRRFVARTRALGPAVRFSLGPEAPLADCARPALVALANGAILLVGDRAVAGKGREVGLCRCGEGWDQVEGR